MLNVVKFMASAVRQTAMWERTPRTKWALVLDLGQPSAPDAYIAVITSSITTSYLIKYLKSHNLPFQFQPWTGQEIIRISQGIAPEIMWLHMYRPSSL